MTIQLFDGKLLVMSPKGDPREKKFTMLMSDEEHSMLMELAAHEDLPASIWIRRVVRQLHDKLKTAEAVAKRTKR